MDRDREQPVSITRLHLPITLVAAVLLVLAGAVVSWYRTSSHAGARGVHVDEQKAIEGGGVAFRHDVTSLETRFERKLIEEHRKTRRLLKSMEVHCKKTSEGFGCRVELPEPTD